MQESNDFSIYCLYEGGQDKELFIVTAAATITSSSKYGTLELLCTSINIASSANDTGVFITQGNTELYTEMYGIDISL